jgi:hypothetical protein
VLQGDDDHAAGSEGCAGPDNSSWQRYDLVGCHRSAPEQISADVATSAPEVAAAAAAQLTGTHAASLLVSIGAEHHSKMQSKPANRLVLAVTAAVLHDVLKVGAHFFCVCAGMFAGAEQVARCCCKGWQACCGLLCIQPLLAHEHSPICWRWQPELQVAGDLGRK